MKTLAEPGKWKNRGESTHAPLGRWLSNLPNWLVVVILVVSIGGASVWYLWPSPIEFPMDDTYIHMTYARNLAEEGKLIFNDAGERGVGTSSILWVLLIAGGYKTGISLEIGVKLLGITSLVSVSVGLYLLLRGFWRPAISLAGALLVGLSGNMLWFSLSGMETSLFLALGVWALLAYREERWSWLGICLGLVTLTRPEGLALALAIGTIEILHQKRVRGGIVLSASICFALIAPWFLYLLWRSGTILPTSGMIKHYSSSISIQYGLQKTSGLTWINLIPGFLYILLWVAYLLEFTLGGMSLPAPRIMLASLGGELDYTLSLWSIPAWGMVLFLLVMALRRFRFTRRGWSYIQDKARRPMIVLLAWVVLHNLAYMAFLPAPGTSSRYGAVNHILLWLVLLYGLKCLVERRRLMVAFASGLVLLAAANTIYWNGVYDANLDHMRNVRIAAAHYIRDHIPLEEVCAASDVGALRYHSGRAIVDMGGLIDPDAFEWFARGDSDLYLVDKQVDYLALPGRSGMGEEGWLDLVDIMGLSSSRSVRMEPVATFEIDHARWLQGYLPTTNYQHSVVIYRVEKAVP